MNLSSRPCGTGMISAAPKKPDPKLLNLLTAIHGAGLGVWFGSVTIRFEQGKPTLLERHENVKLTQGT